MNPYQSFVSQTAQLLEHANTFPLGEFPMLVRPAPLPDAPKALIFSPHPDDEVVIGALALRLLRESKFNVINVAVTQGSNKARQPERWQELTRCCQYIGFGLVQTRPNGLEGINLQARNQKPAQWAESVNRIAELLAQHQPRIIFFPHATDANNTHIGTHYLVADALAKMGNNFSCLAVQTEFWAALPNPNLMVESSEQDVIDLLTALTFHVGEVQRNPYHLRFPAWLIDNVRRGAELVGEQGGAAPDFTFATLYRLLRWHNGQFQKCYDKGRFLTRAQNPSSFLE